MSPVTSTIVMLRLFARRLRTSMSAYFTNSLTPPTGLGLLASPRGGFPSVGQRVARSLSERWPAYLPRDISLRVQGHQLAHTGGAAWSLPLSNREQEWTPSRATSLCSPSCRCSAQSLLGRGIETFLARCFLRSV